jgi:hypothetical protein
MGDGGFQRGLVLTSGLKRGRLTTVMSRCTFSSSDKLRVSSEIAVAELGTKRRNHGIHGIHGKKTESHISVLLSIISLFFQQEIHAAISISD